MPVNRSQFESVANRLPIGRDPAAVRQRIEAMEQLLERAFTLPGTNYRIGLDVIFNEIAAFPLQPLAHVLGVRASSCAEEFKPGHGRSPPEFRE